MTVCGNRTDDPGFFTPCTTATGRKACVCGDQVKTDQANQPTTDTQENR